VTATTAAASKTTDLVSITAHGVTAHLVEGASPTCVRLATSPPTGSSAEVCLSDAQPLLGASASTVAGTTTVVYGIGAGIRSARAMVDNVDVAETKQAVFGDRLAFVFVVGTPDAGGIVLGQPVSDDEAPPGASFGSGMPGIDPNPQREEAVDLPPPAPITFVFEHQRQIWALLDNGATVLLTGSKDGAGGGMVSPDRSTVLFGRVAGIFDDLMALDVRTGETRRIGTAGAAAFSEDGALAVALPYDDSPVPVEIAVYEPGTFTERRRIRLGTSDAVSVATVAWSRGESELLIATGGDASRLLLVDVGNGRVQPLGRAPSGVVQFGRGDRQGRHFALRDVDGRLEVGSLTVASGRATFVRSGVVDRKTPEAVLGQTAHLLGPLGKVRLEMLSDVAFRLAPGETEAALVGDDENLFLVSSSGELTYLLSKVRWAGTP
jgi:hypothetical protein